jgi:hypothetical protein
VADVLACGRSNTAHPSSPPSLGLPSEHRPHGHANCEPELLLLRLVAKLSSQRGWMP